MSAASRSLGRLAQHCERLAADLDADGRPLYNGHELWTAAADMIRRTAESETWRSRVGEWLSWRLRAALLNPYRNIKTRRTP